jgi:dipeptidase E
LDLLLLSNSTNHGEEMFAHAAEAFVEVVGEATVTFIPYALADWDGYADRVTTAFGRFGVRVASAHRAVDPALAILDAEVVMVGGGNTFRLLDSLYTLDVLDGLRYRVRAGETRYMGASAGTNLACPSIRTTNDMPICMPPRFDALGLLPFQINLHYVDTDPGSTFMGETREERIMEFLEENDCPVLALYEGTWLRAHGGRATVTGPARLFRRGRVDVFADGVDVTEMLDLAPAFDRGARPARPAGARPAGGAGRPSR